MSRSGLSSLADRLAALLCAISVACVGGVVAVATQQASPASPAPQGAQATPSAIAPSPDQPTRPQFRTNVNAVVVDLRVVDRDGKFVDNLTKNDFRIFEDGNEQVVSTLSLITIPIPPRTDSAPAASRVSPDVASNAHADEGRLYFMVLDDAGGHPLRAVTVRALAHEFIEHHLTDADQVALVAMSGRREMTHEFTHDRKAVLDTIDRYDGGFGGGSAPCPQGIGLESFSKWLSQVNGRRKSLVFVTENVNGLMVEECAPFLQGFLTAAARGNVSLYIIDPTGVPTAPATGIKPVPLDDVTDNGGAAATATSSRQTVAVSTMDRRMELEVLAEMTGGMAFGTHSNDFTGGFDRIVEENSSYYLLAYSPTNDRRDGRFRSIKVEVNRPGLKVRARSGYAEENMAAKPATIAPVVSPELDALLKSPIPVGGLTLSVSAVPFLAPKGTAALEVIVEARATDLFFANEGPRFNGAMDLAIAAADQDGKIQTGERGSLTMRLLPQTRETMATQGVRFLSTLQLKPGRYRLKVAATDTGGGPTRGSVQYEVVVPDMSKGLLAMSGLALGSTSTARTPFNGSDARWKSPLGMTPTTKREFTSDDELRVYVELYDRFVTENHQLTAAATIRSSAGNVVFTRQVPARMSLETAYGVVVPVPLKGIAPGDYVLTLEAKNSKIFEAPISRQIPFTIR